MKQSISESQFIDAFKAARPDNFSYYGLIELFEYFEQLEDDIGEEIEFDVIGICCEFSEYTVSELAYDYGYLASENDLDPNEMDLDEWEEFLRDYTQVIKVEQTNSIMPEMNVSALIIQEF